MNEVYKINDILDCTFLKIPKAMFANTECRKLSSDAKLTYALLYDRLSLSMLNGWINDNDEVYLYYTRDEITEDLGITYKKAISAFKELTDAGLITETRSGRGIPNKIYIVKAELSQTEAKDYTKRENLKCADSVCLENMICQNGTSGDTDDMSDTDILTCQNGISRTADMEYQDVPKSHTNKTDININNIIKTDNSKSIQHSNCFRVYTDDTGQTDDDTYSFDEILENCQLDTFEAEERKVLYDALERMYYSDGLKVGDARLPQKNVRSRMYEIDVCTLTDAISKLHLNDKPIRNITGYVMSTIFNCITEEYSLIQVDPYLNHLRSVERVE